MNLRHGDTVFLRDIFAVNLYFSKAILMGSPYSFEQNLRQVQGSAYSPAIQPIALAIPMGIDKEKIKEVQSL